MDSLTRLIKTYDGVLYGIRGRGAVTERRHVAERRHVTERRHVAARDENGPERCMEAEPASCMTRILLAVVNI